MPSTSNIVRRLLLGVALAAVTLTAVAATASARTLRIHAAQARHGVLIFKLPRLRGVKVMGAVVKVNGRRIAVRRSAVRAALAHGGVVRAPYVSVASAGHPRAVATRRAVLVVSFARRHPAPPTTPSGGGVGTTCSGPFGVGHWPGACWRPYADSSPFNQPIPANARVMGNSSAIVNRVLGFGPIDNLAAGASDATDDWEHPVYYSQPTDPVFTLHCTENWGRCDVEGMQVRIPDAARPASGGDGHLTVVDQQSGWEYDFWQVQSKPAGGGTLTASWGGRTRIDGDGRGSAATAAGYGNLAGIIRGPELAAGQINHALFMVVHCDSGQYVYPAAKSGSTCSDPSDAPPMGSRFQLDMSDAQIAALAVPDWKKAILRAMAHYGMYMGDTGGGSWGIQIESGASYTSFGVQNPFVTLGQQSNVPTWNGDYVFSLKDGVDWGRYLRVIDPCVAQGSCA